MVRQIISLILLFCLLSMPVYSVELDTDGNDAIDLNLGGTNAITASGARTNLGLVIGTDVQAYDADLTTYAGITPSADAQALLAAADYDAMKVLLDLVIGTNVQAYNAGLTAWTSWVDPNITAFLYWNDTAGAFQYYPATAWRLPYFGASSAITELAFGAQYTLLQSGGASAAPTWTATLNFDPIVLPNGANPTVDATGETALDTDGANEASDMTLRIFDGTNTVAMGRKLHCIQATVIKPNDLADAQRDLFPIWCNNTGMVFTITEIKGYADVDDVNLNVEVVTDTDWSAPALVDALTIAINSTGVYTGVETTISDPTIAHDECITLDFDDTDVPGFVKVTICGWFNANVD